MENPSNKFDGFLENIGFRSLELRSPSVLLALYSKEIQMNPFMLEVGQNTLPNPNWADVHAAILAIGLGSGKNTVLLTALDGELPWLTISGKRDELYQLTIELKPVQAFVLIDPNASKEDVEVTFPFGEWNIIERRYLVNLGAITKAAKYYYDNGIPDPSLAWEERGKSRSVK